MSRKAGGRVAGADTHFPVQEELGTRLDFLCTSRACGASDQLPVGSGGWRKANRDLRNRWTFCPTVGVQFRLPARRDWLTEHGDSLHSEGE